MVVASSHWPFAESPYPAVLYGFCLFAVLLLAFRGRLANRVISLVLAAVWIWMALDFYVHVFDERKPVTWLGAILLLQALVFLLEGLLLGRLEFQRRAGAVPVMGALFLVYALVVQPALELVLEPDPFNLPILDLGFDAVLFTFGLLLFLREGFRPYVLLFPLTWAAIGGMAIFGVGEARDYGLMAALVAGTLLILPSRKTVSDVEGNRRQETWYEHAALYHSRCGRILLSLMLMTCLLGFLASFAGDRGESHWHLLARHLGVSAAVLAALTLGLWLALPAWYNAGFRLLAWEVTRGLREVRRLWDWLTARWGGVIILSALTLWACLEVYKAFEPRAFKDVSPRYLALAGLAVGLIYAIYRARRRIVIAEFVDYTKDSELEGAGKGLASRLRNELASITTLYRTIDEAMPPNKGKVVHVTVGVEDALDPLTDVIGPDATAEIMGFKIPVGFFLRTLGWLVRGPRITGSLHKEGEDLLLVADLSGGGYAGTWRVSFRDDLIEEERQPKTTAVYRLAEQLAYRIITSVGSLGSLRWEAVRHFTNGLRSYRTTQVIRGDASPELRNAEREFIFALSMDRMFSQCHYNLGVVYQSLRTRESAEAAYRQTLEEDPDWAEAYYALATVYFEADELEKAGTFSRKMIEIEPGDPRAWNLNGVARYAKRHEEARRNRRHEQDFQGPEWKEIVRSFEIAAAMAWRALCSAALRDASRPLRKERHLAVRCVTNLGIVTKDEKKLADSRSVLDQAFRLSPRDGWAHIIQGESLFEERKWDTSQTALYQVFGDGLEVMDHVERWIYLLGVHSAKAALPKAVNQGREGDEAGVRRARTHLLSYAVPPESMILVSRRDEVAETQRRKDYAAHLDRFDNLLGMAEEVAIPGGGPFANLRPLVQFLRRQELDEGPAIPLDTLREDQRPWAEAQIWIHGARQDLATPGGAGRAPRKLHKAIDLLKENHALQIERQGLHGLLARAYLLDAESSNNPTLLMSAVRYAEQAVAQEPGSGARRWILGDSYAAIGDLEQASAERETALRLGPSHEVLYDPAALSRIARDYLEFAGFLKHPSPDARLQRGLKFFQRILQSIESRRSNQSDAQFAAHAAAHFWVGRFHCELEELDKGIDHLLIARSMTFRPIEIGLRLGNFYSLSRSYREAELAFGESLKAAASRAAHNGSLLADEAQEELQAELFLSHAMLLAERGVRLEEAEDLCRKAETRIASLADPRRQELQTLHQECLGWVLFRKGKLESGAAELERAADVAGTARLYTRLARVYEAQGDWAALKKARRASEQAKAIGSGRDGRKRGVFDLTT